MHHNNDDEDDGFPPKNVSVETSPHTLESAGVSIEEKVDRIIETAVTVKTALDKKTRTVVEMSVIVIAISLFIGMFLLWRQNVSTDKSQAIAKDAYIQALVNSRDFLQYRRDFAETRDCPVEYFRALLEASRDRRDLSVVAPPCTPIDLPEIDAKIAEVDRKIAVATK